MTSTAGVHFLLVKPIAYQNVERSVGSNSLAERAIPGLHDFLLHTIRRLSGVTPDARILDLGCATGAWLERLAGAGYRDLTGVDKDLSEFAAETATCVQGDLDVAAELGLGDKAFSLITAIEVIEHLEHPDRLFSLVARHMTDDGYFLITTPNIHSVRCRFRFAFTGKLAGFDRTNAAVETDHIYPVLLTCLERVVRRYNLEVTEKWTYPPRGGQGSRPIARVVAALCAVLFPNEYPGDSLCILIRRGPADDASGPARSPSARRGTT